MITNMPKKWTTSVPIDLNNKQTIEEALIELFEDKFVECFGHHSKGYMKYVKRNSTKKKSK